LAGRNNRGNPVFTWFALQHSSDQDVYVVDDKSNVGSAE